MTSLLPWAERFPWINFDFNPSHLDGPIWAMLGECSSKIEHVSGTPLHRDVEDELCKAYIAKGIHATTAIEGNTLSEEQVRQQLEQHALNLPPSQQYLEKEVENVFKAYNSIPPAIDGRPFHLTPLDLRGFNRIILDGLPNLAAGVIPGQYRNFVVGVYDYRAPDPEHLDSMTSMMCDWLNRGQFAAEFAATYVSAILRAIVSHLYIAWVHPFGDGNGRTARIVEYDILMRAGVPLVCSHLLSDHYNRTRAHYYRALSLARQHPRHFVEYAVAGLRDALRQQIGTIRAQQTQVAWINYVHTLYNHADEKGEQARRRREIALWLASRKDAVAANDLPKLNSKLAVMYSGKTVRTLQRDIAALATQQLVVTDKEGKIRANLELIQAFLPFKGKGAKPKAA